METILENTYNLVLTSMGEYLGQYIRPDGSIVPAIYKGDKPPLEFEISGIECVISLFNVDASALGRGRLLRTETQAQVTLTAHNGSLSQARSRLVEILTPAFYRVDYINQMGDNLILPSFQALCYYTNTVFKI